MRETRRKDKRGSGNDRFPIVGIGASAGGLRALQSFFDHLPAESGMAFVVIVHLDPNHASQLAELLGSHTSMPVCQVARRVKAEPNNVYVIPPNKGLSLTDGHLELSARKNTRGSHSPIDLFFRTLAETHETDAIAIVLSGTGTDGMQGIRSIKERGGITMVQAPAEAEHGEMPRSAISTGQVDVVLPAAELAPEVVRISRADGAQAAGSEQEAETDEPLVGRILAHIGAKTEHDFGDYKRSTVLRRLRRRMHLRRAENFPEYLRMLRSDPDELRAVFNDLLITVTSFFRDPATFDALERLVIPKLFDGKGRGNDIRMWVAGCATGEEAYSLAILLCEHAARLDDPPGVQIFATDVHDQAFAFAREGLYAESVVADVSPERLERFFSREPGGYRVKTTVREKVLFASHNLLKDPPFLRLDLVSCRNLLIYLQRDAQQRVLDVFHYSLHPGAYLFLGSSETVQEPSRLFAAVDKKARIYRSLAVPHPLLHLAASPASRKVPPSGTSREPGQSKTLPFGALHQQLVEAYAPPSLVVNSDEEVVHLSDRAGKYLQLGGGEPTQKLLDMVRGDLTLRLRALLRKALVKGEPGQAPRVRMEVDGKERFIDVIVRPLPGQSPGGPFALVIFNEQQESPSLRAHGGAKGTAESKRLSGVRQVQGELKQTKALLQATVEEHEATVEELKASNEELQSINEEQRATSEELETSKEELQSANEELRTINQEQRNKNEELVRANSDIQNLIDSTDIGTLFLDRELRIRRYTPAITEVFNFVPSDRGRPISHVTHKLKYEELVADARAVLQSLARLEREVSTDDGRWFAVRLSPYRSVDDRIDGVVLTVVDTTERKRAELDRQALLEAAEAASAAKSEFIGVMSHEFRTPLNAIVGYAEILNVGAVGPVTLEQSHHLERIAASARHLSHMIDDVLTSARTEAGTVAVDTESVDLIELVRDVAAAIEPLALAKKLQFALEVTEGSTVVVTDPTKLRQILFNLLGNAVRFTDRGRVSLRVRVHPESVIIEVEDTGIGIASDDLERVFERFWQADRSMTSRRGGTGLGLTVSRSLAQSLGGDLAVESQLGRGSLFTVRLPRDVEGRSRPD